MKPKILSKIKNNLKNFIQKKLVFLIPTLVYDSIEKISVSKLKEMNVDTILLDLDNTLVPWNETSIPNEIYNYLLSLKKEGFKICIVSNALPMRVKRISEELNIPYIALAAKPSTKPLRKAIKLLQSKIENTVIIGDQLFTDILAGNRLGIKTILVKPIAKFELITSKFIRMIERKILSYMRNHIPKTENKSKS
ncbi:MAG: YqeG family HAD IIIA-type phosphatase [Candidatus Calescibacterium sp.]|nr:YqeG family HAD IIIA-type phosphatase [Candidatus Calescibacterium sp.]MCX7972368.1 YqeG family HAD IIIA-type phosphatase [bacterium]MDW8195741.1 YqeG family HAD IIIA-type phosphatase [Candidatus Calescibacterium sp.]